MSKNLRSEQNAMVGLQQQTLLDIFIMDYCDHLEEELRSGFYKTYVGVEENLGFVKGKIQVARNIYLNPHRSDRLACAFDEYIEDNFLNQVFKKTLGFLYGAVHQDSTKRRVNQLLSGFSEISDWNYQKKDLDNQTFDRSNERFKSLFERSKWLLSGWNPDVFAGRSPAISLLFPMERLFEDVIGNEVSRMANQLGDSVRLQGPSAYLLDDMFRMKPDICWSNKSNGQTMILDTKWKLLDSRRSELGISMDDVYQMHAYGVQYKVSKLMLLYPYHEDLPPTLHSWNFQYRQGLPLEVKAIDLRLLGKVRGGIFDFRKHLNTLTKPNP